MPLVFVVFGGSTSRPVPAAGRLQTRLARRGLRVVQLRRTDEIPAGEPDVVILTCRPREVARLAARVEQAWTRQWEQWYTAVRHPAS